MLYNVKVGKEYPRHGDHDKGQPNLTPYGDASIPMGHVLHPVGEFQAMKASSG